MCNTRATDVEESKDAMKHPESFEISYIFPTLTILLVYFICREQKVRAFFLFGYVETIKRNNRTDGGGSIYTKWGIFLVGMAKVSMDLCLIRDLKEL